MKTTCELCYGHGWYWARTNLGHGDEMMRPCPNCNPEKSAQWAIPLEDINEMNTQASDLPQVDLRKERPAYFGMIYDGNKLEAHDVNIVHQWSLTPNERAYLNGILDMAIYNIMEKRREETRQGWTGNNKNIAQLTSVYDDRTEQLIIIEPIKHEVDDES